MSDLVTAARNLVATLEAGDDLKASEDAREFIERITFASAEEIREMLNGVLSDDWMGLPPWARNLAYRLACLQRPNDPELLKAAAADLISFGPDWDAEAAILKEAAEKLE